ncbi:MAG: enoyl-CoA hydratase/isomerase family protein [Pseudomonadales bacterium]
MSDLILYDCADGIGTLTINRAEKKNAMTYAMLREFISRIGEAGADPAAKVIILTGVPGAFCAGTDLSDLSDTPEDERGSRGGAGSSDRPRWWPIVDCPKPVICAVDGPAVGMGAEFTSQCDIRIATPNARFAWNFVHRGLVPDTGAGSWLLPRLIGTANALRLLYTGEFLSADAALALGYVHQVVAPKDLAEAARSLAASIARGSPFSQRRIKALVYEGLVSPVDAHMARHAQALAECFASDDHREGVASFLERRDARFTGT